MPARSERQELIALLPDRSVSRGRAGRRCLKFLECYMDYHLANIMVTFHLPAFLAELFKFILENKFATDQQIAAMHRTPDKATVRMTVYRLRMALRPYNLEIFNDRGAGYWMAKNDKIRVQEFLASDDILVLETRPAPEDAPEKSLSDEAA